MQVHARIPDIAPHILDVTSRTAQTHAGTTARTGRSAAAPEDPTPKTSALDIAITQLGTVIVRRVDPDVAGQPGGSTPRVSAPQQEDSVLIESLESSIKATVDELDARAAEELAQKNAAKAQGSTDLADPKAGLGATAAAASSEDEEAEAEAVLRAMTAPPKVPRLTLIAYTMLLTARAYTAYILSHWAFDAFMMVVILYSCATLTLDSGNLATCAKQIGPEGDRCRSIKTYLSWSDFEVMIIFVVEAAMNIFVRGVWGHRQSYFRSPWRVLDFVIAVFSVVSEAVQNSQFRALRALRAVRALRPLRLVSRFPQLQLVVDVSTYCPAVCSKRA